ncbi:MAG: class 1 fructose-bisphosphatase [Deltaproteobacteria bacterium]|nr:class 1 fructose-bisphosphatase [Deltaproteobacteria bacterium]
MTEIGFKDFETLESFIAKEQHLHPQSRGAFSNLLRRVGLATKIIGSKVQRAGLLNVLGSADGINVQGEQQAKLDVLANEVMRATFRWMPSISGLASEEDDDVVNLPTRLEGQGQYVVLFDPLDGSSNIDANVSVGTIFSIHRCQSTDGRCRLSDFLQPGNRQVAAGYVVYGSSTMFVYTTGSGVHGFTLDPEVGEYVLSHENIRVPDVCKCFSANDTNYKKWDEGSRRFADHVRYSGEERYKKTSSRYVGSLVSDFHRNLLYGGIFMYPADAKTGKGKLRLLYEASPLAMVIEQAGGAATTGPQRILDIVPKELHQRVPLIIGNKHEVELYEKMVKEASAK